MVFTATYAQTSEFTRLDGRLPHCRCAQALVKAAVWWASGAEAGMTKRELRGLGILDSVFSVRDKLALDISSDGVVTLRTDGGAGTLPLVRLPLHPPAPRLTTLDHARSPSDTRAWGEAPCDSAALGLLCGRCGVCAAGAPVEGLQLHGAGA